jgi:hypothetical protein
MYCSHHLQEANPAVAEITTDIFLGEGVSHQSKRFKDLMLDPNSFLNFISKALSK